MAAWLRGGGTGSQPSYWEALDGLHLPVRILVGSDDTKFSPIADEMAGALPDASVTRVPAVGHLPHVEAPDRWAAWVRGVLPPS